MENRVIKFRAWNGKYMLDSGYGDWVSFDGIPYTEADQHYNTPNIEIQRAKDYILMQFTGLKDKNGIDIYEGDLVQILDNTGSSHIYEIKYRPDVYMLVGDGGPGEWLCIEEFEGCNVIGNIYQNSELLKI